MAVPARALSPLRRARETCELCGLAERAEQSELLLEWDYGDYEGLTSAEIEKRTPAGACGATAAPAASSPRRSARAPTVVIEELLAAPGPVAIFSHGHILRVLGARWIELEPAGGGRLGLSTGSLSLLDEEHAARILGGWNDRARCVRRERRAAAGGAALE